MKNIRILAAVLTVAMALSLIIISASAFSDVTEYADAVNLLSSVGVIRGYSSSMFGPDDGVTRWQMALLISKLITGNVDTAYWESPDTTARFNDVSPARHYLKAISYASEHGIIKGRSDTVFDPDSGITLQDGATMAVRALGYPAGDYDSEYPRSYMTKAEDLGLFSSLVVDGRPVSVYDDTNWQTSLTRAQTAQLLYNAAFAVTYYGGSYITDVFKYSDEVAVLAASGDFRITPAVGYAREGELKFIGLMDDGTLRGSFSVPESVVSTALGSTDYDQYVGCSFRVISTGADHSNVISFKINSSTATYTTGLAAVSGDERIAIFDTMYDVVNAYTLPREKGVKPYKNEIIVYSASEISSKAVSINSGTNLTSAKIAATSAYYELTTFDDNADGMPDRAIYRPFSFGKYEIYSNGGISLAGGSALNQITYDNRCGVEPRNGDWVMYRWDPQTRTLVINKVYTYLTGLRLVSYTPESESTGAYITYNDNQRLYIGRDSFVGATGSEVVSVFRNDSDIEGRLCDVVLDEDRVVRIDLYDKSTSLGGTVHFATMGVVTKTIGAQSPTGLAVCLSGADDKDALDILTVNGTINGVKQIEMGSYVKYEKTDKGVNLTIYDDRMTYTSATPNAVLKANADTFTVTENGAVTFSVDINDATTFIVFDDTITPRAVNYKDFNDKLSGYKAVYVSKSGWNGDKADLIYIRRLKNDLYGSSASAYSSIVWIGPDDLNDKNVLAETAANGDIYRSYTGADLRN
nr:S-layer homology domain-containing protein [Clostridiales bacterium]